MATCFIAAFFKISLCLASISSSFSTGLSPPPVAKFDFRSGLVSDYDPSHERPRTILDIALDKSVAMAAARLDGRQGMERATHGLARKVRLRQ